MTIAKSQTATNSWFEMWLNTPKGYVTIALLLLLAFTSWNRADLPGLVNVAAAVGGAMVIDVAVALIQKRKRIVPDGALLTGMIVAMALSAQEHWYVAAGTAAIGILAKHLLKVGRKPIFNPAAFGLLVAIMLFKSGQSWWGALAELPAWCAIFVAAAGLVVTNRVNKFPVVFSFLGTYFTLFLGAALLHVNGVGDALRMPFTNSVLFLALFMVSDLPTSPIKAKDQIIFGVIAAVISVADFIALNGLSFLLLGLLIANAWNAWRSYKPKAVAA